jgi:hypothetical protein
LRCQSYKHDLKRNRKRRKFDDGFRAENDDLDVVDGKRKFHIDTFNTVIDKLVSCIGHKLDAVTYFKNTSCPPKASRKQIQTHKLYYPHITTRKQDQTYKP